MRFVSPRDHIAARTCTSIHRSAPRSQSSLSSASSSSRHTAPAAAAGEPAVSTWLRCGALWDGRGGKVLGPTLVEIRAERIVSLRPASAATPDGKVIDLSALTCVPGLIDSHTHVLLQGDITSADYDEQLLKQSPEYRTILATMNARRMLSWGFTTIRESRPRAPDTQTWM